MTNWLCEECNKEFKTGPSYRMHKSRNKAARENGGLTCSGKIEKKQILRAENAQIGRMSQSEIRTAVTNASTTQSTNAILEKMSAQLERQNDKIESQSNKIDSLASQNDELKSMMIELQNNPRLLVVCNKLYPIEQLDLKEPQFQPVLEILDKELPEYANLGNSTTGQIHAKAIKTLNHIQPTAVKEGEDVYFKTDDVLSKDNDHKTTKAFIDAISKMGYEYAQKASGDLKSDRESDTGFKKEILENASTNSIPNADIL